MGAASSPALRRFSAPGRPSYEAEVEKHRAEEGGVVSVASALRLQRAINARRAERRLGSFSTLIAADFMTGGSPIAAEAYDRRGAKIAAFARREEETLAAFRERVREAAHAFSGAARVKLGDRAKAVSGLRWPAGGRPQRRGRPARHSAASIAAEALELIAANRRVALVAGRRWGKTSLLAMLTIDAALAGRSVGVFCPTYKLLGPCSILSSPRSGSCLASRSTARSAKYASGSWRN